MLDNFPQSPPEYDSDQTIRDFMLMDAAYALLERDIQIAMKQGDVEKVAPLFVEKKKTIAKIIDYLRQAYIASKGEVRNTTIFAEENDFCFPIKGFELWERVAGQVLTDKEAAQTIPPEPTEETPDSIARAITLSLGLTNDDK